MNSRRKVCKKAWLITTAIVVVFLLVLNILATTVFYGVFKNVFGGERAIKTGGVSNVYFTTEYDTKDKVLAHGNELNERINEEGIILLKNGNDPDSKADDILPIITSATNKTKVSVFGKSSVNLVYGGSGSGGGDNSTAKTIFDSLTAANYEYNDTLKNFYSGSSSGSGRGKNPAIENGGISGFATGETPVSLYNDSVKILSVNMMILRLSCSRE